ncbi:MAG: tRNA (guanine(10)-N(2))-dimethyltransferase [Promethearchaeota archaeon]
MEEENLIIKKEGLAQFYIYSADSDSIPSKSMNVFYNKKMEINRDISNLAIIAYSILYNQDKLIVVDSMSASGISSIRMIKECNNIKKIFINDINPLAVDLIKKNVKLNNLNNLPIQVEISEKDANLLFSELAQISYKNLNKREKKPNIISIDPFGTPNRYVDSAFKAIQRENGFLCITATDTAVLFGTRPNACIRKYLSKPLHTEYCKEIGARILICFASRIANINKLGIVPLLTFYSNHFIRIFILTFKDKKKISKSFKNYGFIIHCKCGFRTISDSNVLDLNLECPICGNNEKIDYAGPLWLDKLHDERFVKEILDLNEKFNLKNKKRINKLLNLALAEINMPISYYNVHKLTQKLKLPFVPKLEKLIAAIKEKGYETSRTHFDFLSIKSNIDINSIKTILLEIQNQLQFKKYVKKPEGS